jgi:Ca2+-binding RTX toxin-like protein
MTRIPIAQRLRRAVLLLAAFLCFLTLGLAARASASGSGYFRPSGALTVQRFAPAAAPLPGGKVLVVGGYNGAAPHYTALRSAEVFDPATGTFTSGGIGLMSAGRVHPAVAPLPDGRVLVAGGSNDQTAEVFDPATNTFSSAGIGSMSVPRADAAAAPLPDGRVLVAGGSYNDNVGTGVHYLSSAEVFDPATNTFSSAGIGLMSVPRVDAAAAPLPDGRVLIAGGVLISGGVTASPGLSSAEIFDPATGTFTAAGIGAMTSPRPGAAAAALPDGALIVGGGKNPATGETFDPATNTFSSAGIGSMSVPRLEAAAAPLPHGRVLVAGGADLLSEIFVPATCRGKQLTIVGSVRDDLIKGTRRADVIAGLGGDDRISGLAGNDVICGGSGNDVLNGGRGDDHLFGESGRDRLKGGASRDKLKGGAGKDKQFQ